MEKELGPGEKKKGLAEVRHLMRSLLEKELAPKVEETEARGEFYREAMLKMGELGLNAPLLPAPYGIDCPLTNYICAEEMGRVLQWLWALSNGLGHSFWQ